MTFALSFGPHTKKFSVATCKMTMDIVLIFSFVKYYAFLCCLFFPLLILYSSLRCSRIWLISPTSVSWSSCSNHARWSICSPAQPFSFRQLLFFQFLDAGDCLHKP
ncbi:hypothetical protein BDR07DRAFT_1409265 [Suillus spraguei]|nr:hypothetical protein BDR07DRAFT_1409265 [Suillus spraguei]